jgi:hypothetical protein
MYAGASLLFTIQDRLTNYRQVSKGIDNFEKQQSGKAIPLKQCFNADPDQAFFVNANPDTDRPRIQIKVFDDQKFKNLYKSEKKFSYRSKNAYLSLGLHKKNV